MALGAVQEEAKVESIASKLITALEANRDAA